MKIERCFSAFLVIAALGFLLLATQYKAPIAYDPLGPRSYPLLVLSLLLVCSLYLLIFPRAKVLTFSAAFVQSRRVGLGIVVLFAYALLFKPLGFVLSTFVMMLCLGALFLGKIKVLLPVSVLLAVGLFLLFDKGLDVSLPAIPFIGA